jgi:phosphatidylglycerophosphate synthase
MKENQRNSPQRNSPLRKFLEPLLTKVARKLDKIGVKANQVTAAGTYLTALGSFLKMSEKNLGTDLSYPCLGLFFLALACDGLDGSLARLSGTAGEEGAKYDLINDRVQELLLNAARIANASQRMDAFGVLTAILAGLTNPLPSYIRAMVEEKGGVVAETGKNPLSFLGTRGPRAGLAISATCFPEVGGTPFQPIADLLITFGNISSTAERLGDLLKSGESGDEKLRQLGRAKKEVLKKFIIFNTFAVLTLGVVGILSILERHKIL